MKINLNATRATALLVAISIALPACTTAQLQKQYTSFDTCFREQKAVGSIAGGIIGGVIGGGIGGGGNQGKVMAGIGAIAGVIVGQKVAWQSCLKAFPPRIQTTLVAPPTPVPTRSSGPGAAQALTKSLNIKGLTAQPLVFGRDLEVAAQYIFVSDKPDARDVKARVYRNLIFVTPDGQKQELVSFTEDTIQQGTSRTTFAIPTPSTQDAKELLQTRDWAVRFVVEADGLRSEEIVPLQVPELPKSEQATKPSPVQQQPQSTVKGDEPQSQSTTPSQLPDRISVQVGTRVLASPNSTRVVTTTKKAELARVLQRTEVSKVPWLQVELPGGIKGWIKGGSK